MEKDIQNSFLVPGKKIEHTAPITHQRRKIFLKKAVYGPHCTTAIRKVTGLPETRSTLRKMTQQKQILIFFVTKIRWRQYGADAIEFHAFGLGVDSYAVLNTTIK